MCILYSKNSRKLLLEKSKLWNKTENIYKIFNEILTNKYIGDKEKAKEFYDKFTPENILLELMNSNEKFKFNPSIYKEGYDPIMYIRLLYNYLNTSCIIIDKYEQVYDTNYNSINYLKKSDLYYSPINHYDFISNIKYKIIIQTEENLSNELNNTPEILCINIRDNKSNIETLPDYYKYNYFCNKYNHFCNKQEINKLNDIIKYNGEEYILDSVILDNYNREKINIGHAICGITCKKERYIYNGWLRNTIDISYENIKNKLPCELIKYNWNVNKDNNFCLNHKNCRTNIIDIDHKDFCFSFSRGLRILIYIKKIKKLINEDECSKVITIPKYNNYWFNTLLMSILYSENSRNLLLEKSKLWVKKTNILYNILFPKLKDTNYIYDIFNEILTNKYIGDKEKAKEFYDKFINLDIISIIIKLKELNKYLNKTYILNNNNIFYIKLLYNFLNTSCIIIDKYNNYLYYSNINNIKKRIEKEITKQIENELKSIPEILCINIINKNIYNYYTTEKYSELKDNTNIDEINTLNDIIIYNDQKYILDSVILDNYNREKINIGHAICGITCNKNRYIYNGSLRSIIDKKIINKENNLPCELINYNWNVNNSSDICLHKTKCKLLDFVDKKDLCFSFSKGDRILIYVKETTLKETILKEPSLKENTLKENIIKKSKRILKNYMFLKLSKKSRIYIEEESEIKVI